MCLFSFFTAGDKKVKYLMKKWKRNDIVLLESFLNADKRELNNPITK